jgi:inorganic pyrophosphatase
MAPLACVGPAEAAGIDETIPREEETMRTFRFILALTGAISFVAGPMTAHATDAVNVIELRGAAHAERASDDDDHGGILYLDAWTLVGRRNFLSGYRTQNEDGTYNLVVEIPTGTTEKWETCTSSSQKDPVAFPRCNEARPGRIMVQEVKKGVRRVVSYLGYPGNYGSLPRTQGADGDPLDIIAIGPELERGSVVPVKVVGVVRCVDDGDQDDKVIALTQGSPLYAKVNTVAELDREAVSGAEIVRTWFDGYKGPKPGSKMDCPRVDDEMVARKLISDAQAAFTTP